MKIPEIQQAPPLQKVEGRTETEARQVQKNGGRRIEEDVVELSSSVDQSSTRKLEQQQAERVAAIKARLQEGSYRVDSTLVARKMLLPGSGI